MRLRRGLTWIGANVLLWIASTVAFGFWIAHEVQEEYRLGERTATDGDAIMIPIGGFAMSLGLVLLVANTLLLVVSTIRRRRSRPVT